MNKEKSVYQSDTLMKDFFEGLQNLYSWDGDIENLKGLDLTYDTAMALGTVTGTSALIEKAKEEKVRIETTINNIKMIMETLGVDSDEAMNILKIPVSERGRYIREVSN